MDADDLSMGWITWEVQQRNRSMARELDIPLYEITERRSRLLRYLFCTIRTLRILGTRGHRVWICQNPSIVLSAIAVCWGRITGHRIVIDAHNAAIENAEKRALLSVIDSWSLRNAAGVIVSNPRLAERAQRLGAQSLVLPDPLPRIDGLPGNPHGSGSGVSNVFVVCTWSDDEPFGAVLRAAQLVPDGVVISISGDSKGREREEMARLPPNVRILGFVDSDEYVDRLSGANVVVDLTSREDCLVCGGYEAVAAGRPLILSDTAALRDHFRHGTVFTRDEPRAIADAIMYALVNQARLTADAKHGRSVMSLEWNDYCSAVLAAIRSGMPATPRGT